MLYDLTTPNIKTGFAPIAQPRQAHLRRGLVGAWVPQLGRTGRNLLDYSRRHRNAIWSDSGEPNYQVHYGRQCVFLAGISNTQFWRYSALPFNVFRPWSVFVSANPSSIAVQAPFGLIDDEASGRYVIVEWNGSSARIHASDNSATSPILRDVGQWSGVTLTYNGNGTFVAHGPRGTISFTPTSSAWQSVSHLIIGKGNEASIGHHRFGGGIGMVLAYNRVLTLREHHGLAHDPLGLFRPKLLHFAELAENAVTHTTDTLLQIEQNFTHTTNALLRTKFSVINRTDALLQAEQSVTHTTGARLINNLAVLRRRIEGI